MRQVARWGVSFVIMMAVAYGLVVLLVPSAPGVDATPSRTASGSADLAEQLLGRAQSLNSEDRKQVE